MSWWKFIPIFIAIGGVWWVLYHEVDLDKIYWSLYIFPKATLAGVLLLSVLILILKAARFWTLLHRFGIKTNFWQTLKVSVAGSAASPLPGGESFRGLLLKHEVEGKMSRTSAAIISQAYFEVAIAVFLMVLGIFLNEDLFWYIASCLIMIIVFAFALTHPQSTAWIQHLLPKKVVINKFFNFLGNLQEDFRHTFIDKSTYKPNSVFFEISALSLVSHLLGGVLLWLIFSGLQMQVGFILSLFLYVSSIVLSSVGTFSPGGIGVTEGGLIGLMAVFQLEAGGALAALVLFRSATLLFGILLGVLFLFIFYAKPLWRARKAVMR